MNLNIEEERREFEAAAGKIEEHDPRFVMNFGTDVYFRPDAQRMWDGWLLAKRAAVGSAEPVGKIVSFGADLKEVSWAQGKMPPLGANLYTAPPEPVSAEPVNRHSDDIAVQNFAIAMSEKMVLARDKGRDGWEDCDPADLSWMLREHVEKGDPRDVANFCMMLWNLGHPIYNTRLPADMKLANDPSKKPIKFVKYQAFEDAAKQLGISYPSAPPSTDAKDS